MTRVFVNIASAACLQVKVSLPGLEQLPKKFIPLHQETVEASQAEVHESEIQVPIEKKGDVNRNW